jgi:peptidoglycan/xylan/chitin deacetylase (PgdA/CDA1 family)
MKKYMLKYMLYNILILFCITISFSMKAEKVKEIQMKHVLSDTLVKQVIEIERDRVIKRANKLLFAKPLTVTGYFCSRSAGGEHDFYSEGPYWWPDPANPDGPFIRKDGLRNPENFDKHDNAIKSLSWIVGTQTSAYLLTGEEKYAATAMRHLNAWFVDSATKMNPNMLYAQAIKGICTGRGVGIIDANSLIEVAQSVRILEQSQYVSGEDIIKIREWFRQFLVWLTTHPYGIDEMKAKNNHGTWWLAQVAAYASLTEDEEILQNCRNRFMRITLPDQMAANGSFPLELERTKPFAYSLFNLDAMSVTAFILSDESVDLWNYSLPDGRGLKLGLGFMMPYIEDIKKWPFEKDVSDFKDQPGQRPFILLGSLSQGNAGWFSLWKTIGMKYSGDENRRSSILKNPILWIGLSKPEKPLVYQKKNTIDPPKIILKLDDLQVKNSICQFIPVLDYLSQNQIKAGLGAIAARFDNTALNILKPYLDATNSKGDKLFEVWHHGLDHIKPEFTGTPYSYQKDHFEKADQLMKNALGVQMHSFGTPYNADDSTTKKVISEYSDYKIFMFAGISPDASTGIINLDNRVNMENGTGNPEFGFFVNNYNKYRGKYTDYMILQGHPNKWSAEKIDQFKQIVDFLLSQGCEFVLPYEYYTELRLNATGKTITSDNGKTVTMLIH